MSNRNKQKRKDKHPEDDRIEQLEKELREMKSLNRSLLKRLKKVDREYHKALEQDDDNELQDKFFKEVAKATACPQCSRGSLTVVVIAGRELSRCNQCEYRSKARKL